MKWVVLLIVALIIGLVLWALCDISGYWSDQERKDDLNQEE